MDFWPFSWSSEYSISSSWPRKHILTCTDLSSQALHTRHGPLGGLRSAHVAIWNTHLSSYPSVMGNVLVFCWVEIWILPVLSVLSVLSVPYGPVMYQILRLKLVWEVASGWVTSFRAQRTRSNDTQMPPMTYADIITFQYIGHHHILGCQCKSDVLKGHVVPLTRLKPSNSNAWDKIHDVQEQPVMQYKSFA